MSRARQNLSKAAEEALNELFMLEFDSEYQYLSMASWLNKDLIQFPGLHQFTTSRKDEKRNDALKLIRYLNYRGEST